MRFSFWPGPAQSFQEVQSLAQHVEQKGWDGLWFADHFMPNAKDTSGPWYEAWTTLAALASSVPRLRLGPLVTGNTYRHPAVLAKMAATVDHISGGRCVLGLGSGWQENEHLAYGIEFSTVPGRLKRLEEACQVIKGLFSQDQTNFDGAFYQLKDAPLEPKPVQTPLPLMIGGGGEKVTPKITARYADEWNVWGTPEILRHKSAILDQHCETVKRDPAEIQRSAVFLLFLSNDTEKLEQLRKVEAPMPHLVGNSSELVDLIGEYQKAGVQEIIIPDFNLGPREAKLDTVDCFFETVAVKFRS